MREIEILGRIIRMGVTKDITADHMFGFILGHDVINGWHLDVCFWDRCLYIELEG